MFSARALYLHLPRDQEEMKMKVADFEANIQVMAPSTNSQYYYNHKSFHSLNVQAVCDCRGLFLDAECRWSGSVHDAKVFANFRINKKLQKFSVAKNLPTYFAWHESCSKLHSW